MCAQESTACEQGRHHMFDVVTGTVRPDFVDTAPITGSGPLAQRWAEEEHGLKVTKVEVEVVEK